MNMLVCTGGVFVLFLGGCALDVEGQRAPDAGPADAADARGGEGGLDAVLRDIFEVELHATDARDRASLDDGVDGPAGDAPPADASPPDARPAPRCGDGNVDPGEECDNPSSLCLDCLLTPPAGWRRCEDSAGRVALLFVEDWAGSHTWGAMRDRCRSRIEGHGPRGFAFYGPAVFADRAIWNCFAPRLAAGTQYYIGLRQRAGGDEPSGGWAWIGYNGEAWREVADLACAEAPFDCVMDNTCGEGDPDCGRLLGSGARWDFCDYGCASEEEWDGICMIQFA